MLLTILLSAILLWMNHVRTIGEFAALCLFQFLIWVLIRQMYMT